MSWDWEKGAHGSTDVIEGKKTFGKRIRLYASLVSILRRDLKRPRHQRRYQRGQRRDGIDGLGISLGARAADSSSEGATIRNGH
jgi:hypothetical protein